MATQLEHATDCRLERAIWNVWGFVRLNKDSLDSDRACKVIRKAFEDAAEEIHAEVREKDEQIHKLRSDLHAARAAIHELNKEE
jgi:hypothetical protein